MPDGDVFSRRIPRPWSDVSRRVFAAGEDAVVVPAAVKVLARELRQVAPEGLNTLVAAVQVAGSLPFDERWATLEPELRELCREDDSEFMGALVWGVERAVLSNPECRPETQTEGLDALVDVLAGVIDGCIYRSRALAHGITRLGINSEMIQARRVSFNLALQESDELRGVAMQLGKANAQRRQAIRVPRRQRLPQDEIIGIALC